MRIVIAPDKFKGCLSAAAVAEAIAEGLRRVDPAIVIDRCPMADGGEGTVDALVAATGGRLLTHRVTGPLPDMKVDATFGLLGDGQTAVIEMAAASGLHLLGPEQRNPMNTTTYGTGELLMAAAEMGVRRIILGIGGSATTDGGLGCAQACGGLPVLSDDPAHLPAARPVVGRDVGKVFRINWDDRFRRHGIEILVACDVSNPLTGPTGAAHIFGPQKGASPQEVIELDTALADLARKLGAEDLARTPGAGAAGGLGFGMLAFFHARLRPGIELVTEATHLRQRLEGTDLCITAEGKLDAQSLYGKTPIGVARVCREMNVPCLALTGTVGEGADAAWAEGLTAYVSICDRPMTLAEAMAGSHQLLASAAANALRLFIAPRLSRPS